MTPYLRPAPPSRWRGAALAWALPFLGILLTIATGPLLFPQALAPPLRQDRLRLGALTLVPLAALYGAPAALAAFVHACWPNI